MRRVEGEQEGEEEGSHKGREEGPWGGKEVTWGRRGREGELQGGVGREATGERKENHGVGGGGQLRGKEGSHRP